MPASFSLGLGLKISSKVRFGNPLPPEFFSIGGASPELVAAFTTQSDGTTAGEYYRKASSETTFDGLFTHSVSGLLTMFDSSGTLVWAPHNLIFTASDWSNWPALDTVTRAIYVGTGGNITLQSKAGDKVTINNVQDGSILPIRVYKVIDSDTTATDIIGLY